ncbi:MAG: hypothetical protein RL538_289 [Candidatus Parcubacteria bacterium]|jgi:hypothetical protein
MKKRLSQSTIEKLGYYVYVLIDPRSKKVFYVGKGKGSRIYNHVLEAECINKNEKLKIAKIKEIHKAGKEVLHEIVRHGLTEGEALAVEASLIDFIGLKNLTNIVDGHYTDIYGKRTVEELEIQYEAPKTVIKHPLLLIRINQLYYRGISEKELYEATRKHWKLGMRARKIKYVCAIYLGIIREVYEVKKWYESDEIVGRSYFEGKVAPPEIRDHYKNTSLTHLMKQGSQNPILYVEPD